MSFAYKYAKDILPSEMFTWFDGVATCVSVERFDLPLQSEFRWIVLTFLVAKNCELFQSKYDFLSKFEPIE